MKTKKAFGKRPLIPTKRPTARERAIYFGGAVLAGVILVVLYLLVDWTKSTLILVTLVVGALYVLIGTPLLLGRRADTRRPA